MFLNPSNTNTFSFLFFSFRFSSCQHGSYRSIANRCGWDPNKLTWLHFNLQLHLPAVPFSTDNFISPSNLMKATHSSTEDFRPRRNNNSNLTQNAFSSTFSFSLLLLLVFYPGLLSPPLGTVASFYLPSHWHQCMMVLMLRLLLLLLFFLSINILLWYCSSFSFVLSTFFINTNISTCHNFSFTELMFNWPLILLPHYNVFIPHNAQVSHFT